MAVAAPVIQTAMDEWVRLGGRNSGIVGNQAHDDGFHRAANEVPASDYSRRRDPNGSDGPFTNWNYACAGDFWHGGNEALRTRHREVLARLRRNDPTLSMICEFIGKPWADQPVMYWARWEGFQNLRKYTGQGHDTWSHISWHRSRADKPAPLWTPNSTEGVDNLFCKQGDNNENVGALQVKLKNLGLYTGAVDNDYGKATTAALKAACLKVNPKTTAIGATYDKYTSYYVEVLTIQKYTTPVDLKAVLDRLAKAEAAIKALPAPTTTPPLTQRLVIKGGTLEIGTA